MIVVRIAVKIKGRTTERRAGAAGAATLSATFDAPHPEPDLKHDTGPPGPTIVRSQPTLSFSRPRKVIAVTGLETLMAAATTAAELPVLTYYDDATGERIDLTADALAGWAARVARLLHEGCGLGPGDRAAVLLPPHWQTAAVLLGAWSANVSVSFRLAATAGLTPLGANEDEPFDAVFVARHRIDDWLDHVPAGRHRFVLGAAPGDIPAGYRDLTAALEPYPGPPTAYATLRASDAASVDGTTYREWGRLGQALADRHRLRPGDRVLFDAAGYEHPAHWLLAPFAAGASVVLCANLDRARLDDRIAAERVTRVLS
jgi:uncharacterized protein (TIGR03089 family)